MQTQSKTKTFIIVTAALIAATAAIVYLWYTSSHYTVTFALKVTPLEVTILDNNGATVSKISSDTSLVLANGRYSMKASGQNIDPTPIQFVVEGKNKTVEVNPPYTVAYANSLLDKEISSIETAVIDRYPKLINSYKIHRGELLYQGEWYVTALTHKSSTNDNPRDVYKVILHKVDGKWQVVQTPQIVPTTHNMPDVPLDVIKQAYYFEPRN